MIHLTYTARQMIMFSATWPLDVHNLAEEYMDPNPIKVWIFTTGSNCLVVSYIHCKINELFR